MLSEVDKGVVIRLVIGTQQYEDRLEFDIARTQASLQSLLYKHAKNAETMQKLKGGISCIREIPFEVISKIFLHFIPDGPVALFSNESKDIWSVAQVCRKWRGVALGTPSLWNNFDISHDSRTTLADRLSQLLLPWSRLTRISVATLSLLGASSILHLCVKLVNCRLTIESSASTSSQHDYPPILCPDMQKLDISFLGEFDTALLTQSLCLPNLSSLKLLGPSAGVPFYSNTIRSLVERSACQLRVMHVACDIDEDILHLTPNLLTLEAKFVSPSALQIIGQSQLVPALETFNFSVIKLAPVLDMATRRWSRGRNDHGIHSLHLDCVRIEVTDVAIWDAFRELVKEGEGIIVQRLASDCIHIPSLFLIILN